MTSGIRIFNASSAVISKNTEEKLRIMDNKLYILILERKRRRRGNE